MYAVHPFHSTSVSLTPSQSIWNVKAILRKTSSASGWPNFPAHWNTSTARGSFTGPFNCFPSVSPCSRSHRDLKPDNILLDAMGHAHITDFNVAIHYSERRLHTSVAGSMAYMAPQVVNKKGYSWHIDWWSLGVTAFELIFHKRPFDGRNSEKMTQSIIKDPLRFPDDASQRCSEEGIMALKGVSSHRKPETVLLTSYLSSLTAIPRRGLAVDQKVVVSRISDNTLGSQVLTGTALRTRNANRPSFLMYVIFCRCLTCH